MAFREGDEHFKLFAKNLTNKLMRYGKMEDVNLLALQRKQLERLVALEGQFRSTLIAHPWGPGVYKSFVYFICNENGSIQAARPYFRERQITCIGPISLALDRRSHEALYKYNFNYQFVSFVIRSRRWPAGSVLRKLAKAIELIRRDIIELNMPLAISQARIFWSKAPSKAPCTHLQYMDFVQISCDGLISAVDKFVLPSPVKFRSEKALNEQFRKFRPMAIQRMVGNFIESYSETMVHFFPKDKRKLYRANKFLARHQGAIDWEKVSEAVNKDSQGRPVESGACTNSSEIVDLLGAASGMMVSESSSGEAEQDEERENPLDRCAAAEGCRPDVQVERSEVSDRLHSAMLSLPTLDRKLLRLKGVTSAL